MTTEAITPLRQRMIEDMNARKLGARSQRSHIDATVFFVERIDDADVAFLWTSKAASERTAAFASSPTVLVCTVGIGSSRKLMPKKFEWDWTSCEGEQSHQRSERLTDLR
jgi:hypothetical protein